jgi:hypothetical protein
MPWNPDPDETVVVRCKGEFASGVSLGVAGRRSFRDSSRNDIQHELTGWPAGPEFVVRNADDQKSLHRKRGLLGGVGFVVELAGELLGGNPASLDSGVPGPPQEPANEVDDFPVMWADPGTWARTVPWQLDPARRPDGYGVQIVLTDRRMVFLGGVRGAEDRDLLHTIPRECVVKGEQMLYSVAQGDVRITFFDGSWIRLGIGMAKIAAYLARYLNGGVRVLREAELTPPQRAAVAQYMSREVVKLTKIQPPDQYAPYFIDLGQGYVQLNAPYPAKDPGQVDSFIFCFDPQGKQGRPPSTTAW